MKVFVLSHAGKPLMPTTPRRARLWLKEKRARVVRKEPFTIRLRFATKSSVQKAVVGVDTGSKDVGIAATTNGEVVFQARVHLRDDIVGKMTQRRQYRRSRRSRQTKYRPARWRNRRRIEGWLPPSLRSKAEATVKVVRFVASSLLPVNQVIIGQRSGGLHSRTTRERIVHHQRHCQREETGGGHATQIGTNSASHAGLADCPAVGSSEHQKGGRRFLS